MGAAMQCTQKAMLVFSAAIWLTIQGPAAHAEDATAASFNKNCIGDAYVIMIEGACLHAPC